MINLNPIMAQQNPDNPIFTQRSIIEHTNEVVKGTWYKVPNLMYNSFPELTSKYRMGVSRVLSLLNSDIFDITLTLYTSVSICRIAHLVPVYQTATN